MSAIEDGLRKLIAEVVRDEVAKALSAAATPAEYLSTSEAAGVAHVAQGTIRRWIAAGRLKPYKAGRELRVLRGDLAALMDAPQAASPRGGLTPEQMADRDFRLNGGA